MSAVIQPTHEVRGNYELLRAVLPLPDWEEVWRRKDELELATILRSAKPTIAGLNLISMTMVSGKPILAIHPGCMARNKFRRWLIEYFVELIRLIKQDYDCHIIVIAGPDEVDVGERLAEVEGVHLLSKTSLANVAAFISRCQAFLNTDSGLGHIASCFQITSLTIFGPGDEAQTAPFSPVSQVVRLPIHCSPCVRKKKRDCQVECLTNLKPAEVCTALKPILQKPLPESFFHP